jgi:hypothetical protein
MEADRIDRMVDRLRARDVMAHRTETGVYSYGIRVVLGDGSEALWTPGGPAGLDAQVLRDGVLIGSIPHIPGSERFTDEEAVEAIATARYREDGLYPAAREENGPGEPERGGGPERDAPNAAPPGGGGPGGGPGGGRPRSGTAPSPAGPPRHPWLRRGHDRPR